MKKITRSAAEIVGFHYGHDIGYIRDCRYQPTVYGSMAVYTLGDMYLCCPSAGAKPMYGRQFPWKPIAEHYGRTVYGCTVDEITKHQGI